MRWPIAAIAASAFSSATASAALPSALATAASKPLRTVSSAATEPSSPETWSEAASSAPAPSLRLRPSSRASLRAASAGAVALGALRLLADLGQPLLEVVELGGGRLVLGVEPLLAGVEAGDPGLEGGEVLLGPGRRG